MHKNSTPISALYGEVNIENERKIYVYAAYNKSAIITNIKGTTSLQYNITNYDTDE